MGSILLRIRAWWETADRTQRTVTMFGSLFLAILLIGTVYFSSRPKMVPLFSGLSAADRGMVVNELTKLGVPIEYDKNGNVLVPANQKTDAEAKLAFAEKLPTSGKPGYADFESMGPMILPKIQDEQIKAAIEGELARTIETIEGVSAARVHLVVGEENAFATGDRPSSASVVVTEAAGAMVSPESAKAIMRLVQYAVPKLNEKNITVLSSKGRVLIDGTDANSGLGTANARTGQEIAEARRREADLQAKLDLAFGPGSTIVSVPVLEMNFDQTSMTEVSKEPTKKPIRKDENTETLDDSTAGLGGAASIAATAPGAPTSAANESTSQKGYRGTQVSEEFGTNEKTTVKQIASGNIVRMAINVLVNSDKVKEPDQVREFVENDLGPFKEDPNFSATVTQVAKFDTSMQESATKADQAAASRSRMQQLFSLLPIVALMVVGFMVVKALSKSRGDQEVMIAAMPGGQMVALPSGQTAMIPPSMVPQALKGELDMKALQESFSASALAAQGDVSHQSGQGGVEFLETGPVTVNAIAEKVNVPFEQIRKMSVEKPAVVAMLLKSWLLEDRR